MAYLSVTECRDILDSLALTIERLKEVYGTGTENYTTSKALKINLERILNTTLYSTNYLVMRPLADQTYNLFSMLNNEYISTLFQAVLARIWTLQDNDLDDFLTDNDLRIHPNIRDVYEDNNKIISPSNVMCPPITNMGTYSISEGNGSFTDGDAVNTDLYGPAPIKVKPTTNVGEEDITLTITCEDIQGNSHQIQVVIPGNTTEGTEFDVEEEDGDLYVDVTNVTHSGGNDGDSFQFYSVWERTLQE